MENGTGMEQMDQTIKSTGNVWQLHTDIFKYHDILRNIWVGGLGVYVSGRALA